MKLLVDQNLSYKMVALISDLFPESIHVARIGLDAASDIEIWQYAKDNSYSILTRDVDFNEIAVLKGHPPKIVWLNLGNSRVVEQEKIIRKNSIGIINFLKNEPDSVFVIQNREK